MENKGVQMNAVGSSGLIEYEYLGFEGHVKEAFEEGLQRWPKTYKKASERAFLFKNFKLDLSQNTIPNLNLKPLLQTIEPLLRESSNTEKEGYSQVCFQGSPWSLLNSIPFALTILSFYKSWIVPATSLLFPLIALILPYILLTVFFNIPIPIENYFQILWRMWNGQALPKHPKDFLSPPPSPPTDMISRIKQITQNGWTLFTIGQTMYQPIVQARHFRRLDSECLLLGEAILGVKGIANDLLTGWTAPYLPKWLSKWISECPSNPRQAFAFVMENPFWLRHLLRALGRFEVVYRLASRDDIVPVEFIDSKTPALMFKDMGDPSISPSNRVCSSISLKGHSIVTGPNRGGKSSFMRGIHTNILLSHTYGCAFGSKAQSSYFSWIANGLRLADVPGKESMFERELLFTSGILKKEDEGFGLVLYDEIFHSTNPPDAKRASELFCSHLWKKTNCISIISTHIYSLAYSAPPSVKRLCLASWKKGKKYTFSYKVKKGVCEVSSVDLLLKKVYPNAFQETKPKHKSDQNERAE